MLRRMSAPSECMGSNDPGSTAVLQTESRPAKIRLRQGRGDAEFGVSVMRTVARSQPHAAKLTNFRRINMTKKLFSSLVLGMTLSAPAFMVGCGEEAAKTETPKVEVAPPGGPNEAPKPAPAKAP